MSFYGKILFQILLFTATFSFSASAQRPSSSNSAKQRWVDSVYNKLSAEERIGQLFMVAAYSGTSNYNETQITELIRNRQIGGVIFMQGTPEAQASLTNKYQQMAQVPLLIGMDAEWGLGMRLTGVKDMPRQMMMGATRDSLMVYKVAAAIARQCKRLGVHVNFAPVVDVNNNPNNPVINARSFGENKEWVATLGMAYMHGLQDNGVMACAKHFPGHGDTDADSHKDLPVINKSVTQLADLELYPFKKLINEGIASMMIAHLEVPSLETMPNTPTTLSRNTVTNLLKDKMGFDGLVFTDALNMKGVTKYFADGETDLKAFLAGNDVLLFSQDVPLAISKIKGAMDNGLLQANELERSVKKILAAKYDAGLNNFQPIATSRATEDLNEETEKLRLEMAAAAITTVRDQNNLLPKLASGRARVHYIGLNAESSILQDELQKQFEPLRTSWLPRGSAQSKYTGATSPAANYDVTIVAVHDLSFYPSGGDYGLDSRQLSFLKQMSNRKNVLVVLMGNAYLLKQICDVNSAIVAYEDNDQAQQAMADVLLGRERADGVLPVTPCAGMQMVVAKKPTPPATTAALSPQKGVSSKKLVKEEFVEDAGVKNEPALEELDMFIQRAIVASAFPGCRVLAAKDGKIFYDKAFGYMDYSKKERVDLNTIYDVASLTKVLSTTLAVMRLYEQRKLNLNKTIADYLPWTANTNKGSIRIKDLLMHQAGLKSWIPFYKETLDESGRPRKDLYRFQEEKDFKLEVAKNLYLRNDYFDTVWYNILTSPLENRGRYVYSDLDFYFLATIVQQITGQRIDRYVTEQFYKPMGLQRITYNPLQKFKASEIAPTENDLFYRHQTIRGYVHDQGAAMFGGVAGHAGVFASAQDVAAIFQMLLNGGMYGGKKYFDKKTVDYFTAYNTRLSRRGLGFDKPVPEKNDAGPAGERVSGYAFGHQGFTGTCAWADPETGIVFVFLSNRVNPSSENNVINRMSIRTEAQDYIYKAFNIPVNRERPEVYRKQLAATQ